MPKLSLTQLLALALALAFAAIVALGSYAMHLHRAAIAAEAHRSALVDAAAVSYRTATRQQQAAAECAERLGALREAGDLAVAQREALLAELNDRTDAERKERDRIYVTDPECSIMGRCAVCPAIADRLRRSAAATR
jgi:hypothetical protein